MIIIFILLSIKFNALQWTVSQNTKENETLASRVIIHSFACHSMTSLGTLTLQIMREKTVNNCKQADCHCCMY